MSQRFDLISNLEEDVQSPKVKYQVFEATLGFETAEVLIPLEKADDFFTEALKKKPKSKATLNVLASKFGGMVK